ncbi:hypothetical protein [Nonomuraea maritima]|uniref:hypothetical protein n=1 Tax=Nonomuraea maritima TaxID=683260 RepID=UPI00371D7575
MASTRSPAGRLFDFLVANPHQVRLATWLRLERGRTEREPEGLGASVRRKIEALAEAQAAKRVAAEFTAEDLLAFTLALATAWVPASPTAPADPTPDQLDTRRTAVVEAVRRLTS